MSAANDQEILTRIQSALAAEKFFAPTLQEIEVWFTNVIIPKRTAAAGVNTHRIYAAPRALFLGNSPNPNGLCGDAAAFVEQELANTFLNHTSAGHAFRRILWRSSPFNHEANVVVPTAGMVLLQYETDQNLIYGLQAGQVAYSVIQDCPVLDLYYKKVYTVDSWWQARSSPRKGKIEIGREHEIGD